MELKQYKSHAKSTTTKAKKVMGQLSQYSVWLQTDYRFRFPTEVMDFSSSLCVQTGSVAHPASNPMGTGGPFPGGKARPGRDADHSLPIKCRG
jgi:hypothetical protein